MYVGSRFTRVLIDGERQDRFMADVEGNVVSLYVVGFGTCRFDVNSDEGVEQYLYDIIQDEKRKAIEIVVADKAAARDFERGEDDKDP